MEISPRNVYENSSTSCYFIFHEILTNKYRLNDIMKITALPLKLTSQLPPSPIIVAQNICSALPQILWLETKELFTI